MSERHDPPAPAHGDHGHTSLAEMIERQVAAGRTVCFGPVKNMRALCAISIDASDGRHVESAVCDHEETTLVAAVHGLGARLA